MDHVFGNPDVVGTELVAALQVLLARQGVASGGQAGLGARNQGTPSRSAKTIVAPAPATIRTLRKLLRYR